MSKAERAELAELAASFERQLIPAPQAQIEESVAMLSLAYPAMKASPQEAAARIKLYTQALADLPAAFLEAACLAALRECTFFPSPAEIRKRCEGLALMQYRLARFRHLIERHDREWKPKPDPEPPLSPEQQAKVDAWMRSQDLKSPQPIDNPA